MEKARRLERLQRLGTATEAARQAWMDQMLVRDREIMDAETDGWGVREIARAVRLSPQTVERVLARETAQLQADRAAQTTNDAR